MLLQTSLATIDHLGINMNLHLKFTDEAQCRSVLFTEATDVQGDVVETVSRPNYRNIDIIGVIHKPTGKKVTVDGMTMDEMAPIDGYHANVLLVGDEDGSALDSYTTHPDSPVRRWA